MLISSRNLNRLAQKGVVVREVLSTVGDLFVFRVTGIAFGHYSGWGVYVWGCVLLPRSAECITQTFAHIDEAVQVK